MDCEVNDDVLAAKEVFLSNIPDQEKAEHFKKYIENGIYIGCYYLFYLAKVLKEDELINIKRSLTIGYKSKNPLATFIYGLYALDLYSKSKKETDFLKAQQSLEEAYSYGVSIAKIPLQDIKLNQELDQLKSKIGERQPVKKQIKINNEDRNVYLFTGSVVDRKIISSQNTTTSGGGSDGYGGTTPVFTQTTNSVRSTFTIVDTYGNEKIYHHDHDIDVRPNNNVTIISLDSPDNNIGIHNKDGGYAYYNDKKMERFTKDWFNKIPMILALLSFILFFSYCGWDYMYNAMGLLVAIGGVILGGVVYIIAQLIRWPFNKSVVKKFKQDMWRIL